jgi:hypothetical protein
VNPILSGYSSDTGISWEEFRTGANASSATKAVSWVRHFIYVISSVS